MRKIKIAVLDSGIVAGRGLDNAVTERYTVSTVGDQDGYAVISGSAEDGYGHGTAVADTVLKYYPACEIVCVKICENDDELPVERLVDGLRFVAENIACDIVLLSLGVQILDNESELEQICSELISKGVILISAFDNEGAISYPAAFEKVIGVDVCTGIKKDEFIFVEGSPVNIRVADHYYRVKWIDPEQTIIRGTSFAAAFICAKVCGLLAEQQLDLDEVLAGLRELSKAVLPAQSRTIDPVYPQPGFKINRAIVFPFNKEAHALARFESLADFEITGYYDHRLKGLCGRNVSASIDGYARDLKIADYRQIDWESNFDTVILSCCAELSSQVGVDLAQHFVDKCNEHGKNIYAFEDIGRYLDNICEGEKHKFFFPYIDETHVPANRFGKLRRSGKPVLAVVGTSSKQGKYTLQLGLRQELQTRGYKVGQIGTEPSGWLFGMDVVYPSGYNATVNIHNYEAVSVLNDMIWQVECNNPDIILVGSQSGTVHYDYGNLSQLLLYQHEFFVGLQPDAYVLCVNVYDELDYIRKTIGYLSSVTNGKVMCIVLSCVSLLVNELGANELKSLFWDANMQKRKKVIEESFLLPVYLLQEIATTEKIVAGIERYFKEDTRGELDV